MAITTADEFFTALEKSKLLEAKQLVEARRIAKQVEDPTAVAKLLARQGLITHWQAGQLLAGRTILFVGKYKLIRLLGRGGMANVFLAEHVTMNRRVALKFISRQLGKDQASLERFLAEARAVAALDHPNIVQAYNVDNEGDRYYIVMEYIDGQDLQHLVETDGPLEYALAADYTRQAAEGLAHAHARKMVHCDIKPSNLLVSRQGVVKILDMGLSRLIEREGGGKHADEGVLGSVDYLSPEQALGTPDVDQRTDIYALGCTLYFLLTGHAPFHEGTLPQRILKHQTQTPPDIRKERPGAPDALVEICVKMMAKRPEDRYQSAAEVSRALQQWTPPQADSKAVVPLQAAEVEEKAAGEPGDFASDSWWDEIANTPLRKGPARKSGPMRAVKAAAAAGKTAAKDTGKNGGKIGGKIGGKNGGKNGGKIVTAVKAEPAAAGRPAVGWLGTRRRKLLALAAGLGLLVAVAAAAVGGTLLFLQSSLSKSIASVHVVAPGTPPAKETPKAPPGYPDIPSPANPGSKSGGPNGAPGDLKPPDPSKAVKVDNPVQNAAVPAGPPKTPPPAVPPVAPAAPPKPVATTPPPAPVGPQHNEHALQELKSIDLPPIEAGGDAGMPVSFGPVHLGAADTLSLKILNTERAGVMNPKFVARPKEGAGPKDNWVVGAEAAGAADDSAATEVARIWLDPDGLKFQWLKGAADARADFLRNCGLLAAVGEQTAFLPMTLPQEKAELIADIDKGMVKTEFKSNTLPDPAALRLQLVGLTDTTFPKCDFKVIDPSAPKVSGKGAAGIPPIPNKAMGELHFIDPDLSGSGLRIRFDAKGHSASVEVTVIYRPPPPPTGSHNKHADQYKAFKPKEAAGLKQSLQMSRAQYQRIADRAPDDVHKKIGADAVKDVDFHLKRILALYETIQKPLKLQFRIYAEVVDGGKKCQVDVFKTPVPAAHAPGR